MSSTIRNILQLARKHFPGEAARCQNEEIRKFAERWLECVKLSRGLTDDPEWLVARKAAIIDDVCHCLKTDNRYFALTVIHNPWIDLMEGGGLPSRLTQENSRDQFLVVGHGINGLRYYFARDELVDDNGLKVNLLRRDQRPGCEGNKYTEKKSKRESHDKR